MDILPAGSQHALRTFFVSASNLFAGGARCYLSKFTIYEMVCTSHDFEDVKVALNDRTNWSIELFRSCFTIRLANGGYVFMLSLSFLVMAENMHMRYGRFPPMMLKECVEEMGYMTFTMLFAALDLGVVIVRIASIFALSETPALAMGFILITMIPSVIPLLTSITTTFKLRNVLGSGAEIESGAVVEEASG